MTKDKAQDHVVAASWKEADAVALEARAQAIADWLDHTIDLVEMFEDDLELGKELRATAASVRMRRNDLTQKVTNLRADVTSGNEDSS